MIHGRWPPLALLLAMYWQFTAGDPPPIRNVVRIPLFLFASSFAVHLVGMRIVTGLRYSYNSWPYEVKAILKHTGELAGWILIAAGVLAASGRTVRADLARHARVGPEAVAPPLADAAAASTAAPVRRSV